MTAAGAARSRPADAVRGRAGTAGAGVAFFAATAAGFLVLGRGSLLAVGGIIPGVGFFNVVIGPGWSSRICGLDDWIDQPRARFGSSCQTADGECSHLA